MAIITALSTVCHAQSDCYELSESNFAERLCELGRDFEEIEGWTQDGYKSSVIRLKYFFTIADDICSPQAKPPVLFVHDLGTDGLVWLEQKELNRNPLPLELLDLGYDVYILNL